MKTLTKSELNAGIETIRAVADAIRALGSVPSGHLYAVLAGSMDLSGYEKIIGILKNAGLVTEKNFVLSWVGPT